MSKTVYIETYGCQMNVADSELLFGLLGREGYVRTDEPAEADVMLVNTCAVRDNAEQRVIGRMGELQRHKRTGDVLGVVGCMAQRLGPALLERVPRVDLVVGPDAYRNLPEILAHATQGQRVTDTEFRSWEHYEDVPPVRESGPTAFITVQRGCDYRCTFCIVPYTRGPERSRRLEDVVIEVGALAGQGTTEVTLLGQTVNSYHDGRHDFADLLRAVGQCGWDPAGALHQPVSHRVHAPRHRGNGRHAGRLRARPSAGAERIERCAPSHASPVHARAISRGGGRASRRRYRASRSRPTSSSAFPGETEAQFEETLQLVAEADFDDAYTFKYSLREGTPAVRLGDHVSDEVASARLERLIDAVRANARRKNIARVGETHEVLVERPAKRGGFMLGRTRGNHLGAARPPGRSGSESITPCASPARPAPPSRGRWSRPHWRCCDSKRGGGARRRRLRHAAGALSRFLRLRGVPRRCASSSPSTASRLGTCPA